LNSYWVPTLAVMLHPSRSKGTSHLSPRRSAPTGCSARRAGPFRSGAACWWGGGMPFPYIAAPLIPAEALHALTAPSMMGLVSFFDISRDRNRWLIKTGHRNSAQNHA
jgi:hypothetical protein